MQNRQLYHDPIASRLGELRSRGEGALVAYLMAGDPSPEAFIDNASALVEGGADIIEIGIPFSDPIADGPVIQAAGQRALKAGTSPKKVLGMAKKISLRHDIPIVLLSYYNPILAMGAERFLRTSKRSGVAGLVIPDGPAVEDPRFHKLATKHGIDRIFLAAPNTPRDRLAQILTQTAGFLYLVSLYGVTGPRNVMGPTAAESIQRIRSVNSSKVPVLAGFGVSRPDHVKSLMAAGADGAIVGSALVRITQDHANDLEGTERLLKRRVSVLKEAARRH